MSNKLDKVIGYISPEAALKRERARLALDTISNFKRKYEGASKGKRMGKWQTPGTSQNEAAKAALPVLRNRARDLVRNNPWANSALDKIESNLVGDGIVPQFYALDSEAVGAEALVNKCRVAWYNWTESNDFMTDGQTSFYGSQALAARSVVEGGEALSRRIFNKNLESKIQIQLFEPDFIDHDRYETLKNGNLIIQGVEYDTVGRRVALYLFSAHPGETGTSDKESKRFDIADFHTEFDSWRIGQARGLSWFAPSIVRLRDFDEYQDYQLVKQKISALFTGMITRHLDFSGTDETGTVDEDMSPGLLMRGQPGEEIKFSDPPKLEGYKDYSVVTAQNISAGLGLSYEALTNDYSNVNYSSAKMARSQFDAKMRKSRMKFVYPKLNRYWRWFKEAQLILGNDFSGIGVNWIPPRVQYLDPLKEIKANVEALQSGQVSLTQVILETGADPKEVFKQIANDKKKLEELGIGFLLQPSNTQNQQTPTEENDDK